MFLNCILPVYSVDLKLNLSERRPCILSISSWALSGPEIMSWADFYVLRGTASVTFLRDVGESTPTEANKHISGIAFLFWEA